MALPPTPVCRGCKGKFPVSSLGDTQCEVCGELFKLGNLVWGPRFPFELRTRAVRAVRNCYVELLQEADEHYYQRRQVPGPVFGEDKGSLAPAPVSSAPPATPSPAPAPTPRGAEDKAPRPAEEEDKKAEEEEKEVAEKAEAPPAHESERSKEKVRKSPKEKKESRGEKDHPRRHPALGGPRESKRPKQEVAQSSRGPSPKRGERRGSLEPAIPVKEEDSSEEVEDEAAEEARLDSPPNVGNRSKEPLPSLDPHHVGGKVSSQLGDISGHHILTIQLDWPQNPSQRSGKIVAGRRLRGRRREGRSVPTEREVGGTKPLYASQG